MSFEVEDKLVGGSIISMGIVLVAVIAVITWKSSNAPIESVRKVQNISACTKDAVQDHLDKKPLTRFDLDSIETACERARQDEKDRLIQKDSL